MLQTIGKVLLNSLRKTSFHIDEFEKVSTEFSLMPALPIVNQYHKWLSASAKYQTAIAPHLYPQWAIPELFKLGEKFGLPFHKILNQGCYLKINAPLPRETNLMARVQLLDVKNYENKIRLNQKIWTGPKENPMAVEAKIYAVILKNNKTSLQHKSSHAPIELGQYKELSKVYISSRDAKIYGLISGDMNPIHLNQRVAKLFGLKGSIMHGFGLNALIFEELERHGFKIHELEIKFLSPVYRNSSITIFLEKKGTKDYHIRVLNEKLDTVYMVGTLVTF